MDEMTKAREIVTEWIGMFDPPPQIDFQQSEILQHGIASALAAHPAAPVGDCEECATRAAPPPGTRKVREELNTLAVLQQLKASIDTRINDLLCETKPGYDDSIVGINDAWDVVRKACDLYIALSTNPGEQE